MLLDWSSLCLFRVACAHPVQFDPSILLSVPFPNISCPVCRGFIERAIDNNRVSWLLLRAIGLYNCRKNRAMLSPFVLMREAIKVHHAEASGTIEGKVSLTGVSRQSQSPNNKKLSGGESNPALPRTMK